MGLFNKDKKVDIQQILLDEYDKVTRSKIRIDDLKKLNDRELYIEEASENILKSYNSRYQTDFQKELQKYLNPTMMEKLRAQVDGKDINEIKKEEREAISKVSKGSVGVDSKAKDKIDKKLQEQEREEKEGKNTPDDSIEAITLRAIYESVMEDYYKLKINIQEQGFNSQIATGDISEGDKNGTKLVMYERYLRNIDQRYRAITHTSIIKYDKDIKKAEEKDAIRAEKNERAVLGKNEDNLEEIFKLYKQRDEIAMKMSEVSEKADTLDASEFKERMDYYQEQFKSITAKIYNEHPNPAQLQQMYEEKAKNEQFRDRTVGFSYQNRHEKDLGEKVNSIDNTNDEKMNKGVDDYTEFNAQDVDVRRQEASALVNKAKEQIQRGHLENVEELLQSAEDIAEIKSSGDDRSVEEKQDARADEEIENNDKDRDSLAARLGLDRTNSEEEIANNDNKKEEYLERIKNIEKKIGYSDDEKDIEQEQYVPTLSNRRRF